MEKEALAELNTLLDQYSDVPAELIVEFKKKHPGELFEDRDYLATTEILFWRGEFEADEEMIRLVDVILAGRLREEDYLPIKECEPYDWVEVPSGEVCPMSDDGDVGVVVRMRVPKENMVADMGFVNRPTGDWRVFWWLHRIRFNQKIDAEVIGVNIGHRRFSLDDPYLRDAMIYALKEE